MYIISRRVVFLVTPKPPNPRVLYRVPISTPPPSPEKERGKSQPCMFSLFWVCNFVMKWTVVTCHDATTACPKPSFRAPWRIDEAVVGRGNAGWTSSMSGHPRPCQFYLRGSLLNCLSCPRDDPISQGTELNCIFSRKKRLSSHFLMKNPTGSWKGLLKSNQIG